jgi:hypothetical protein
MNYRRSLKILEQGDGYAIRHSGQGYSVPLIRLRGKWLKEAGFTAGQKVSVLVEHGRLTILTSDDETHERGGR